MTVVLVLSTVSFIYLYRPQVSCQVFFFKYSSNWISIFNTPFSQKTDYQEEFSTGQKPQQLC